MCRPVSPRICGSPTLDDSVLCFFYIIRPPSTHNVSPSPRSKENDSPWDRWTSPTVYTVASEEEEDEKEEEEEER